MHSVRKGGVVWWLRQWSETKETCSATDVQYVTMSKLDNFSVPWLSHVQNGDNTSALDSRGFAMTL